jgi:arylsulfatase A-like enzyme
MKKPNVLLISIDTLRADHVSCYGYPKRTTPNIDKLAEESVVFLQNYSTGVWTPPGHASMLTGLYVSEHGVYDTRKLRKDIPTIASTLKDLGYQTAGFVNNSQVGALVGLDKGHDVFEEVWKGIKPRNIGERVARGTVRRIRRKLGYEDMGAKRTNNLFKSWIETSLDKAKPFYCFLHYIEPHNPLDPPRDFGKRFVESSLDELRRTTIKKVAENPLICYVEGIVPNEQEIQYLKSLYDGEIAYTDQRVGEIIEMLKRNGLYENTMIIVTSDHGEHLGEHGLWSHVASLYREVLWVPLVVKFPKESGADGEVHHLTQLVDIFPTVKDTVGLTAVGELSSGVSLLSEKYHDFVFAEWEGRIPYFIQAKLNSADRQVDLQRFATQMAMIRDATYKYIWKADGEERLYELPSDPEELCNIALEKQEISERLRGELLKRKKDLTQRGVNEGDDLDQEVEKNLKALGYM